MRNARILTATFLVACGGGSGGDAPLDAAVAAPDAALDAPASGCRPDDLAACTYAPAATYAVETPHGRHSVSYTDVTGATRTVAIEVRRPVDAPTPMPIVMWSHGGASGMTDPGNVGEGMTAAIVEAGYVGVFIAHPPRRGDELDALCDALGVPADLCRSNACTTQDDCEGQGAAGCIDGSCVHIKYLHWDRPHDVAAVLDWIEAAAEGPAAGVIDPDRIVYAGHSAGAGATMMVAGAPRAVVDEEVLLADPRPVAFVSQSPQGPGDEFFTEASFAGLTRPHLFLTGVGDDTPDSAGENRRGAFDHATAGDKHLLYVGEEAARHTSFAFETRACSDFAANQGLDPAVYPARCATYVTWMTSALRAFLDAYLRDRAEAHAYLASDALPTLVGAAASWEHR